MDARILLVEDNEINIYVAQLILEKSRMCGGDCKTVPTAMTADAFEEEKKDTGGRNELSPVQAHQPEDIV